MTALSLFGLTLAHFIGDYIIQTDWMAQEKTKRWLPAILHGASYTLPFLFVTHNPVALLIIASTHAVIDRYRLAKHLVWFKNQFAPKAFRPPHTPTGYAPTAPVWLATSLLIVADNVCHVAINAAAVLLFP